MRDTQCGDPRLKTIPEALRHGQQGTKHGTGLVPPRCAGAPASGFILLVERDRLSFRIESDATDSPARRAVTKAVRNTFHQAFNSVWASVPMTDRHRLLAYWQSESATSRSEARIPLIRIMDGRSLDGSYSSECACRGTEFRFPLELVLEAPQRLETEIARALAAAYRYATREHWGLILRVIEEPLDAWDIQHGSEDSDADRDKVVARLEKTFLRRHETELTGLLRKWGIEGRGV